MEWFLDLGKNRFMDWFMECFYDLEKLLHFLNSTCCKPMENFENEWQNTYRMEPRDKK